MSDLFGVGGQVLLDKVHLAEAYRVRVESFRDLIDHINREIAMLEEHIAPYFAGDLGYHAVQAIPASARCWPRYSWPRSATSRGSPRPATSVQLGWADPDPQRIRRHRAPGPHHQARLSPRALGRRRGCGPTTADTPIRRHHRNVGERRGTQIGHVAAARKLLILVYYGLHDGEIRCLAETG